MIIVGAGMAGLLAGNMLANRHGPTVVERSPTLPNNHSAVLRFRSSIVGDTLGIPFKKVNMVKTVSPWRNPVADSLAYAKKNTGFFRSDRSIMEGTVTGDRYIAPPDLIYQMAGRFTGNIALDTAADFAMPGPFISTIPMPVLMNLLGYPADLQPSFGYATATHIKARIQLCDAYVSVLFPDPQFAFSRVSITGDEIIVEAPSYVTDIEARRALDKAAYALGVGDYLVDDSVEIYKAQYAKILPIDEAVRKDFIAWATDKHNVYSLGRYATWRPKLLLDDLVNDVRLIERWLSSGSRYALNKHR